MIRVRAEAEKNTKNAAAAEGKKMEYPQGVVFSTASCGFKHAGRDDLGLIVSQTEAACAGVFTKNKFQAAPVLIAKQHLAQQKPVRAIIVNSGQANACTGEEGLAACKKTTRLIAELVGCEPHQVLPASKHGIREKPKKDTSPAGISQLGTNLARKQPEAVARAMMTTDTFPKLRTKILPTEQGDIRLLGMAKGAGMICPNMATMLGFILCDARVEPQWWQGALARAVECSFNRITVDGDTSTNDCVLALANGASVPANGGLAQKLEEALTDLCQELAYCIVRDAEGGTKVLRINVSGAKTETDARLAARAVGNSPLVKTALYGRDPNWGRIVAALGRSGADFAPNQVSVYIAGTAIFKAGTPIAGDWDTELAPALARDEVEIAVSLGNGPQSFSLLASDLSEDYVRINAEYRS